MTEKIFVSDFVIESDSVLWLSTAIYSVSFYDVFDPYEIMIRLKVIL